MTCKLRCDVLAIPGLPVCGPLDAAAIGYVQPEIGVGVTIPLAACTHEGRSTFRRAGSAGDLGPGGP